MGFAFSSALMDSDEVAGYAIIKETEKSLEKLNQLWEWYRTAPDFVDKLLNIKNLCWWNKNYPVYFAVCERVARELPYHSMTMQFRKDAITGYLHLDELKLRYADDPNGLAEAILMVGEAYYQKGQRAMRNWDAEQTAENIPTTKTSNHGVRRLHRQKYL